MALSGARDRRIAFLSVDLPWTDPSGVFRSFSYGSRKLEASIRSVPGLADVETRVLDLPTKDPEVFLEALREYRPTLIAASTYIWSIETFGRLAEMYRREDPSARFVIGGPAARKSVYSLPVHARWTRYFDGMVSSEGEAIIRELARTHLDDDWAKSIPGMHRPHPLGWHANPVAERPVLDDYASPYHLVAAGVTAPPPGATGFVETFRGCPISCAFCQWGDERADRVHGAEYLAEHLRGIDRSGASNIFFVDAAFNLSARAFRNLVEAERQVNVLSKRVVHGHLYPTFVKDHHLEFFKMVGGVQASIGIQSLDPEVLKRLGRPFDVPRFEEVLKTMQQQEIPIDLEIIFGLPGDDPESFLQTFRRCVEIGDSIRVFSCLALPDALLERADEYAIEFDHETFQVHASRGWTPEAMRTTWAEVERVAATMYGQVYGGSWVGFNTKNTASSRINRRDVIAGAPLESLRAQLARVAPDWRLERVWTGAEHALIFALDGPTGSVQLEASAASSERRAFISKDGVAYAYRGQLERSAVQSLERVIGVVHASAVPIVAGMAS